jgi:5-amino-6-(5-phosphoribosylamino)uracil reductase
MQELTPQGSEWELAPATLVEHLAADSPSPPQGRPWVTTNMVMSMDGAYSSSGTSGALSSEADHALFLAQRWLADAVLVGASTARAERYRRPSVDPAAEALRRRRGQAAAPQLVVVTGSGRIPADQPFLEGEGPTPLLVHPAATDAEALPETLDHLSCGEDRVDIAELLAELHRRGMRRVDCEGGPGLLGQLASLDAIDEFLLTLSPQLVGGPTVGLLGGASAAASFRLHRVLRDGDHLMLSYRCDRAR